MVCWSDDSQSLESVRACGLDSAVSDEPALLSEQVQVLVPQAERVALLAALQTLGDKVDVRSRTVSQRSACFGL